MRPTDGRKRVARALLANVMTVVDALRERAFRDILAAQYRSAIARAEEGYRRHVADEDAVTGGLGEAMRASGRVRLSDGSVVTWTTTYTKLRGRGANPPEKRMGADGVFEIELQDALGRISRKSVAFQAKKNGRRSPDKRLRAQADQLAQLPGGGLVVVYTLNGYFAGDAQAYATKQDLVPQRSLTDVLAGSFLACERGSSRYYYDAVREVIVVSTPQGDLEIRKIPIRHRIRTRARQH